MGGESSFKNCASRDETASAKEGPTLNSSIQQEREKEGVKGRDEREDESGEKARGALCTRGKWDFSVPSPPTLGLRQGQEPGFQKDAQPQHLSLSAFPECTGGRHKHTCPHSPVISSATSRSLRAQSALIHHHCPLHSGSGPLYIYILFFLFFFWISYLS